MLIVISPAKTLKTDIPALDNSTFPSLIGYAEELVRELRMLGPEELAELMNVSPKLAMLNYGRFQQWHYPYKKEEGNNALLTFRGEVYNGLDADTFNEKDFLYAQNHLRILSGLYGVLRPLDVILPYRLEMGTKLPVGSAKNLYQFWGEVITNEINRALSEQENEILINLASEEYFKSILLSKLKAGVITPVFKEFKNGTYKVVSVYAKKARGLMSRFIIQNRISNVDDLKLFDADGYYYNENLSKNDTFVFTRG